MTSRVKTIAFQGIYPADIDVQTQIMNGLPTFSIVGLADKAVAESKERIRSALYAIGLSLPPKRIIVNLSPADLQKEGSHYDLPIALGILLQLGVLSPEDTHNFLALGELALDGSLTEVSGVLAAALHGAGKDLGLICPASCGAEALWGAPQMPILAAPNLLSLINHFKGNQVLQPPVPLPTTEPPCSKTLGDVKGQEVAKRALEIAAAGSHNLLMSGPPGAGKSMLASRLSALLPPLSAKEALEVAIIYSVSGHLKEGVIPTVRPFRSPHHSATLVSLVGGGQKAVPGEISLSHNGVLFLDELPEFSRNALEALRQPLESRVISISRANIHIEYPANFQFIAAMNPCKCGYMNDPERACKKAPLCGEDYQSRLSGPLLDRMDLFVEMKEIKREDLKTAPKREEEDGPIQRIMRARAIQHERFSPYPEIPAANVHLPPHLFDTLGMVSKEAQVLLDEALEKLKMSFRSYHRVIRVARTIADLAQSEYIERHHLAEALMYRPKIAL